MASPWPVRLLLGCYVIQDDAGDFAFLVSGRRAAESFIEDYNHWLLVDGPKRSRSSADVGGGAG